MTDDITLSKTLIPITELDKAYAAGQFDARGFVRIGCQKGRTPRLTMYIRMPPGGVLWFDQRWDGGSILALKNAFSFSPPIKKAPGGCCWSVRKLQAQNFLKDIEEYVHYRRAFVSKSLEFLERVVDNGEKANDGLQKLVEEIREAGRLPDW